MKKELLALMLAGSLAISSAAVFAQEAETVMPISAEATSEEEIAVSNYVTFAGKITSVSEEEIVIDANGEEIILKTAFLQLTVTNNGEAAELKADDEITAYVMANMPAPLVLPAQYSPSVIVKATEEASFVNVDTYKATEAMDETVKSYVNAAGNLVVNVAEEAEILSVGGEKFEGDIDGRDLAVFYGITTRSIPAQTAPAKIYVLNAASEEDEIEAPAVIDMTAVKKIAVGDKVLENAPVNGLLPLRETAESLGLKVEWHEDLQAVTVGNAYMITIDKNEYVKGKMMPIELSSAPVLVPAGDTHLTYVPYEYFTEVLEAEATQTEDTLKLEIK